MQSNQKRLFVGIPVESHSSFTQAISAIQAECIRQSLPNIPTHDSDLHITLFFLGNIASEAVPKILTSLEKMTAGQNSFFVQLSEVLGFPKKETAKIFSVGNFENSRLNKLQQKTVAALYFLGLPKDPRPYTPHITLMRVKQKVIAVGSIPTLNSIRFPKIEIKKICLYESLGGTSMPRYKILGYSLLLPT